MKVDRGDDVVIQVQNIRFDFSVRVSESCKNNLVTFINMC